MVDDNDLDELIKDIAAQHGVAVGRDDPIMILRTINRRILLDARKAQAAMLEEYKAELEGVANRWGLDAKQKAEKLLNAALGASKESMARTLEESTASAVIAVKAEVDRVLAISERRIRAASGLVAISLVAAVTSVAALAAVMLLTHR